MRKIMSFSTFIEIKENKKYEENFFHHDDEFEKETKNCNDITRSKENRNKGKEKGKFQGKKYFNLK